MSNWEADYQRTKNSTSNANGSGSRSGSGSGTSAAARGARAPSALLEDEDDHPMPDFILEEPVVLPEETPLEQLTRHWMNERHAPDILPAQDVLLGGVLDHIRRQSDTIQLLRNDPSTSASEAEHIRIMLAQTEVERVKFIVRSYVRTRLYKIEKYARHIMASEEAQTKITAAEREYASRHANLMDRHFYASVLQSLPESQAGLDDIPHFIMPPMVTEPETTRAVFALARKNTIARTTDGKTIDLPKGSLTLLSFVAVEDLVANGDVELV